MESKPKLYLAGPYGFSEITQIGLISLINILKPFFTIINPFTHELNQSLGKKIGEIMGGLNSTKLDNEFGSCKGELIKLNKKIGENNETLIKESDLILACLDGTDVDSGTAAEIGYSYGLNKCIWGYRNDFRLTGDNYGTQINLQVEYFIEASGGKIFRSMKEIEESIPNIIRFIQNQR